MNGLKKGAGIKRISIGNQGFDDIRENDCFYIDKTAFIKEWWESMDIVTLITRPRRFGKTLNMSMLNCFFSNKYAGRGDLFHGLSIWEDEEYRQLQGTYPVIFLSFAEVKSTSFYEARNTIAAIINDVYKQHRYLIESDIITDGEKEMWNKLEKYVLEPSMNTEENNSMIQRAIKDLCGCLSRYYNSKVLILLDEYDTPMQEAYIYGYWDEFTAFLRNLFNSTFKTNPYLARAVMTGITRVSKESMFSDLNNLNVVTTISNEYSTCFGFTENEVFRSLDELGLSDKKEEVKRWYDGFTFGIQKDIYNPWSIINYLDKKQLRPYWASTSSNGLASRLLQKGSAQMKEHMEELLKGETIVINFDEQIVFQQLDTDESAVWSLLVAGGYLKVDGIDYRGETLEPWYHVSITNLETRSMFGNMFKGWFGVAASDYNEFVRAMVCGDLEAMNHYMNDVALATFSNFDTGVSPSDRSQPEKYTSCCDYQGAANGASLCYSTNLEEIAIAISFYHGFVLGLMVGQSENYEIRCNRESGFGRYDIMLIPKKTQLPAIVIEFKVHNANREKSLSETAKNALRQIEEKNYDAELLDRGIDKECIRHYGFAFKGKKVLIM